MKGRRKEGGKEGGALSLILQAFSLQSLQVNCLSITLMRMKQSVMNSQVAHCAVPSGWTLCKCSGTLLFPTVLKTSTIHVLVYLFFPCLSLQYELAVGTFPYPAAKEVDVFKQLEMVVEGRAPRVPDSTPLSDTLTDFIHKW